MTSLNKETNMKLTKTLLTTAILGFSLASCHSTGLTNTPDQQLDQGFEAVKKRRLPNSVETLEASG